MSHSPHDAAAARQAMPTTSLILDEARYHALIMATGQLIWTCAPEGDLTKDMHAWCAFTDQAASDTPGQTWWQAIHPGDR